MLANHFTLIGFVMYIQLLCKILSARYRPKIETIPNSFVESPVLSFFFTMRSMFIKADQLTWIRGSSKLYPLWRRLYDLQLQIKLTNTSLAGTFFLRGMFGNGRIHVERYFISMVHVNLNLQSLVKVVPFLFVLHFVENLRLISVCTEHSFPALHLLNIRLTKIMWWLSKIIILLIAFVRLVVLPRVVSFLS